MSSEQLEYLIEAIMKQGNSQHNTRSGAFLEYISELASKQEIRLLAEACALFVKLNPTGAKFIAARIPGILHARYFTALAN
jgi:hypothetical protein